MAAIEDRRDEAGAAQGRGEHDAGQAEAEFPLRQRELHGLLLEIDKALARCGVTGQRRRQDAGSDLAVPVEPVPVVGEPQALAQRAGVREVAGAMLARLEARLETVSRIFARLSVEERASVATLLRLPESGRGVIATLLRLPESDRQELSIGFRLSDAECHALARLLEPDAPPGESRPTITIVDPAVAPEGPEVPSAERAR